GCAPLLIAGGTPGASGNPAALVTPRLDAGLGPVARLAAQAFNSAVRLYEADSVIARGVLQLAAGDRDPDRFARIAASGLFEPGALTPIDAAQTTARLGEPAPQALDLRAALVVEPGLILAGWSGPVLAADVARVEPRDGAWAMLDATGEVIALAEAVILAAGQGSAALWPDLPLRPVRGQASWTQGEETTPAVAWGGYVLPTRTGVLFGATHDRDEAAIDLRAGDHERNRATLAQALPRLAATLAEAPLEGRAGIRATTPDHLPLAGPVAGRAGLFALTGFGSRGFSLAPLLAEHVAALVLGAPSPLPADLASLVDPDRFRARAARRGRNSVPNDAQTKPLIRGDFAP
ncbi:FAD-dependent oxidoreductase, partial [Phenylobacterium sp.]|uniref:FAD-dependent oxidoreductase n=1 Tax=Phenylobacterium sp. TaxID=1871053 RepID=UPI00286D547E